MSVKILRIYHNLIEIILIIEIMKYSQTLS